MLLWTHTREGLWFGFEGLGFSLVLHLPAFKLLWTHINECRDAALKQAPVAAVLHVKHLTIVAAIQLELVCMSNT